VLGSLRVVVKQDILDFHHLLFSKEIVAKLLLVLHVHCPHLF
jgi:hypothetical protein